MLDVEFWLRAVERGRGGGLVRTVKECVQRDQVLYFS